MAEKTKSKSVARVRWYYEVDGKNKLKLLKEACPKCGPGVYLAVHKNRKSCGRCGYKEEIRYHPASL
jgi:small subunit ribosomal protein S27Ae